MAGDVGDNGMKLRVTLLLWGLNIIHEYTISTCIHQGVWGGHGETGVASAVDG